MGDGALEGFPLTITGLPRDPIGDVPRAALGLICLLRDDKEDRMGTPLGAETDVGPSTSKLPAEPGESSTAGTAGIFVEESELVDKSIVVSLIIHHLK